MDTGEWLSLEGVATHNLAGFDLQLPKAKLTVITGVSGSGKSSLAFDTLFREGQRRFLSLLPAYARRFASGIGGAEVGAIRGLGPAVAIGQRGGTPNPRATVGTISEVQDLLRLLFARLGEAPEGIRPTRGLFSFNGEGACPACQGLGLEDRLDPDLLVADPTKSLRQGALRVSTPNGYLMYSQVTLEVLDQVLHAHGGDVDTPWQDLSEEVRGVVLHGSDRLRVPTGKHPLENRLKWSGITARPREEGFYRGLLPVMEEILRKRNDSILRFVRTGPCPACQGTRLRPEALAVTWRGHRLPDLTGLCPPDLARALEVTPASAREAAVLAPLAEAIRERCGLMADLGLAHLRFDRPAPSLGPGETQRLRLLGLALGELRGLLVVLDEPSAGLHPAETGALLRVLRRLRDRGQTVVVVDHDETLARGADWLVDLGPGPGAAGGRLLFSGPPADLLREGGPDSPTRRWLLEPPGPALLPTEPGRSLPLRGLARHGRALPDLDLPLAALTVVTGGSGTGKTSLLEAAAEHLEGHPAFRRILCVDASPIGRTPRSNTATYTGLSDHLRDLFAATPEAKARGFGKGHFSFNTAGGRCEACEGAGVLSIGMQHLGSAEVPCEVCAGRRFHADVLEVRHAGLSIADVLDLSVDAAERAFRDHPRLARPLRALQDLGLGHLTLGQSAPSLSGGEAQRVKLATELARAGSGGSLIVLDEPTTGLHAADVATLAEAFGRLTRAGHTLLVADHDPGLLRVADARLDLGAPAPLPLDRPEPPPVPRDLHLWGVRTHTLRDLDITFPGRGLTVVTGPSGSGKSSLVMDTLLAAAQARFADLVAPFARRFLPKGGGADLDGAEGLTAAVAVAQTAGRRQPRATVGTLTGLDEGLRLLWSRLSGSGLPARAFSPATLEGACPACRGLGLHQVCDPDRLVAHPDRALDDGALADDPYTRLLGEPGGQFMATLRTAAEAHGFEISGPWRHLAPGAQRLALEGTGTRTYEVAWSWARGTRSGTHRLSTAWAGLCALVEAEYARVHEDGRGERLEALLMDRSCPACGGDRLQEPMRSQMVAGLTLPYVQRLDLRHLVAWLEALPERLADSQAAVARTLAPGLLARGRMLIAAGLGHLSLRRETATLSGGEAQRARLCEVLSGDLSDLTCILDEPTQGLHPADSARLVDLLKALAAKGNAVVAISHDPVLLRTADHLLELGPGGGPEGGRVVASGPPEALMGNPASATGAHLRSVPRPPARLPRPFHPGLRVRGAHLHTLQDLDVNLPASGLVAVTGVSGSGKSSLVRGVLAPSLEARRLGRPPVGCRDLELLAPLGPVHLLDQAPLAAGSGSTVATLLGLMEPLRRRFAATPEAKARRLGARAFGPSGACPACEGRGHLVVAMDLLPDVTVPCDTCEGSRFLPEVLACRLEGLTLPEVLDLPAREAERRLRLPGLAPLLRVGLGHLRLGLEAPALSGGEAQRLRLARILTEAEGPSVLLLDEPTRGLGADDTARLLPVFQDLAEAGSLVVAITHDLTLIREADWVLDLGPGGGADGGRLLVAGPPQAVQACPESPTGAALRS